MSYINEVFNYLKNNEDAKKFFQMFGGRIAWGFEYGFVYVYGNTAYLLNNKDFKADIQKSIQQNENILITYPKKK